MDSSTALKATVQQLLAKQNLNGNTNDRNRFSGAARKKDLELALTVLLVDLAGSDQNFDQQEYNIIVHGLMRMFGTPKTEASALVNQAQTVIRNLRGVDRFGALLRESLSSEEKETVMDVIEEVIGADGIEDDYEIYLRQKLKNLLGIS